MPKASSRRGGCELSAALESGATAAICPFRLEIEEQQLTDLFRRLGPTRWPSKELVADRFPLSPLERSCLTAPAKKLFSLLPSTGIASTHEKGKEILTSNTAAMEADLAVNPFMPILQKRRSSTLDKGLRRGGRPSGSRSMTSHRACSWRPFGQTMHRF